MSMLARFRTLLSISLLLIAAIAASPLVAQEAAPVKARKVSRPPEDAWWKHAVIYEIYPRSFQDSNGDGIGDLNGITERLGYLQSLGVDAIWIAPMYPSPQVDFGYDISDYENIDPQYGTLADFDNLLAEAKKHDIRVVLDMVLNHTSDKHKWFLESESSKTNPKRDFYVWHDGKQTASDAKPIPPNNWVSLFGGSAWEYNANTKQFYYHKFYKQQPDLNWRNRAVETAMFNSMRFWLDKGVAGFRLDAVPTLFEDEGMRDEPVLGGTNAQGDPILQEIYTSNLPEVHGTIRRMRTMVEKYPGDRVLIGETYLPNTVELDKWYGGENHDELQLPMDMLVGFYNHLDVDTFRKRITEVETQVHGSQPLLVFDNHDNVRSWDRYGDGIHNHQIAKLIATILLTARATALMYQGEELGQPTTTPTRVEDVKDPIGITGWPKEKGRDGERTPMQWDASTSAGFSTSTHTWLPIPASYKTVNVTAEEADPDSILNWHKKLIAMRRNNLALHEGSLTMLDPTNPNVLSFLRTGPAGQDSVIVALNFTSHPQTVSLNAKSEGVTADIAQTLAASDTTLEGAQKLNSITLPPFASWIGEAR